MANDRIFSDGEFTADELENSIPFDPDKRLRGDEGAAYLDEMLAILAGWEAIHRPRKRARKGRDEDTRRTTADTFLANLVAAAFNRVDPERFVAVPFSNNALRLPLAPVAMRSLRDALMTNGLVEGQEGFLKVDLYEHNKAMSRLTRLRATAPMQDRMEGLRVSRGSVVRRAERGVIHMKDADPDQLPEPEEVTASREVLERLNARLAVAPIELPDEAWARVRLRHDIEEEDDKEAYRAYSGDQSSKVLRRVFNRRWTRGGRIYGGWWMHLPKAERKHITIEGAPVVELDFSRLHPTMLFHRAGVRLDFDPYCVPGLDGPFVRELGKRTFNRLINKKSAKSGMSVTMNGRKEHRYQLPKGVSFRAYFRQFVQRLEPIAQWFGTGVGLELQREDSDLAVAIIARMERSNITVLPVHDSFIVPKRYSGDLKEAMREAYKDKYGFYPEIK
jgi:hypothetical protein